MTKINDMTISKIANFASRNIGLDNYKLDSEFFYQSLPFCVIDSIFSIGVRYETVKKTVNNFCVYNELQTFRTDTNSLPSINSQYSVSDFLNKFGKTDYQDLANSVFKNRQRTSSTNGILKAEAVICFLKELLNDGINYFQDLDKITDGFENRIKQIKGQKSGISLQYFFMLAGNDNLIKPDRMVIRFIESIVNEAISQEDCQEILNRVSENLISQGTKISPRELDNAIWNYQRDVK